MNVRRMKRPSPALVVAMVAMFVALGGTAGAVVTQAVPLAKRALIADNAKKLGGQTSAQLVAQAAARAASQAASVPGPASTAAGLVVVKTVAVGQITPGQFRDGSLACDAGQKVMGGGLSSDGAVVILDSFPSNDTTWNASGINLGSAPANMTIWATCLR
jgi:hypothetical protein